MTRRARRIYPDLRTYFNESGESQAELAKRLNKTQPYISKLVNRRQEPRLRDALRISQATGVPLEGLTVQKF